MLRRRLLAIFLGAMLVLPLLTITGPRVEAQSTTAAATAPPNGKTCGGDGQPACPPLGSSTNCDLPASEGGAFGVPDSAACPEAFTLPAWSDAARWDQEQYYDTIQVADLNGNGQPDLVALGSQGIEAYELSPDHGQCGASNPAFTGCGTWVPILDRGASYGFAQANGIFASSLLHTGNVDGHAGDEILVGNGTSLVVASLVPKTDGSGNPYPAGTPGVLARLGSGPAIDAAGGYDGSDWSQPQYRTTITLADFDGNDAGAEELIARSANGFWVWDWAGGVFGAPHSLLPLDDAGGYDVADYYDPILAGDVDGDGAAELMVRGADGQHVYDFNGSTWSDGPALPALADGGGWDGAPYYAPQYRLTQQLADIDGDGDDEFLARGTTHLWSYDLEGGVWQAPVQGPDWSDANFATPARYSSIQSVQAVLGADPAHDGVEVVAINGPVSDPASAWFETWTFDPVADTWSELSETTQVPSSADWTQPRYYQSLRTTPASTDPALNALIYRDPLGIHSLDYDDAAGWDETNADFLDVSSGPAADAYAAINCRLEFSAGQTVRSGYDSPDVDSTLGQFSQVPTVAPTDTPSAAWNGCDTVAIDENVYDTVRSRIGSELAAASALNDQFTEVRWIINETFANASLTMSKAQSAVDASKDQKEPFKWGELVAGLFEATGAALEFKFEKPFAAITSYITAGASGISAGVEFSNAKSEETSTEIAQETIQTTENQLQTRYGGALNFIQDERAALVQDWGEMQTMMGLSHGPWVYQTQNDPYIEAASLRQFELHMWASAVTSADWRVYVCADQLPGWNTPGGADSSRTHCDNPYGYAGATAAGAMPNGVTSAWIVNHLNASTVPPIKAPSAQLVRRFFHLDGNAFLPSAGCQTNWVSYSNSDNPGCAFGIDEVWAYSNNGPFAFGCSSFYFKSALVHSSAFDYDGPCDHYQIGPDGSPIYYSDVAFEHPFYSAITSLAEQGYVTGYPDGTYRPTGVVTRGVLSETLYRMAGRPDIGDAVSPFSDVPPSHLFHDAITWMALRGHASGYPDGTFRPGDPVTRQTASAMLYHYAGSQPLDDLPVPVPEFTDVDDDHPFADQITWMVGAGVAKGYNDGSFGPTSVLTRQGMAQFLFQIWASGWAPRIGDRPSATP